MDTLNQSQTPSASQTPTENTANMPKPGFPKNILIITITLLFVTLFVILTALFVVSSKNKKQTSPTPSPLQIPAVINSAQNDLAKQLGVSTSEIIVEKVEKITWNDGSLGCPQPGDLYTQSLVSGYLAILKNSNKEYEYHTDDHNRFVLCNSPAPTKADTSTANWKTYKSKNFSLKYPSEWNANTRTLIDGTTYITTIKSPDAIEDTYLTKGAILNINSSGFYGEYGKKIESVASSLFADCGEADISKIFSIDGYRALQYKTSCAGSNPDTIVTLLEGTDGVYVVSFDYQPRTNTEKMPRYLTKSSPPSDSLRSLQANSPAERDHCGQIRSAHYRRVQDDKRVQIFNL